MQDLLQQAAAAVPGSLDTPDTGQSNQGFKIDPAQLNMLNSKIPVQQVDPNTQIDSRTSSQKIQDAVNYGIPDVMIGAINTVAGSIPGLSEADGMALSKKLFSPAELDNYNKSPEAYNFAGAFATSFIPILGMTKIMRAKKLYSAVEKVLGGRTASLLLPSKLDTMDKINTLKAEATVYAKNQVTSFTEETTPAIMKKLRDLSGTEVLDAFKVGIATDAGIYALTNSNQTMYGDMNWIEKAAMFGVPDAAVAGISGFMLRRSLKAALSSVGKIGEKAINVAGLPVYQAVSRPGDRYNSVYMDAAQQNIKQKEKATTPYNQVLHESLNRQITTLGAKIKKGIENIAKDSPAPSVTNSIKLDNGEMNTAMSFIQDDPSAIYGVVSFEHYTNLEDVKQGLTDKISSMEDQITKLLLKSKNEKVPKQDRLDAINKMTSMRNELDQLHQYTVAKLEVDGSSSLAEPNKTNFRDIVSRKVKTSVPDNIEENIGKLNYGDVLHVQDPVTKAKGYASLLSGASKKLFAYVDAGLTPKIFKGGVLKDLSHEDFNKLTFEQKTMYQELTRKAIDSWKPENIIQLDKNSNHIQLDAALALRDRFAANAPMDLNAVKYDGLSVTNWDQIQHQSLVSKYKDWMQGMDQIGKQQISQLKIAPENQTTLADIIHTLNLPNNGISGSTPLTELFTNAHLAGVKDFSIPYPNMEAIQEAMRLNVNPRGNLETQFMRQPVTKLTGTQFQIYGETRKPLIAILKPPAVNPLQYEELVADTLRKRMEIITGMENASKVGAPLISAIIAAVKRNPARWQEAVSAGSLVQSSQLHTDHAVQTMYALNNQPTIVAVDSIGNEIGDLTKVYLTDMMKQYEQTFESIYSSNHSGDLNYFNLAVHQQGNGWRGLPSLEPVYKNPTTKDEIIGYKIPLENAPQNAKLIEKEFGLTGEDAKQIQHIPIPHFGGPKKYEPLVMTPLAAETMLGINQMSQDALSHLNALRRLAGLKEIPRKPLHMIPPSLADKEEIFLINNHTGELETIATGNTPYQANIMAQNEVDAAGKRGVTLFKATPNDLRNYNILKSEAYTRMVDYSTTFRQTGTAKGTSYGGLVQIGKDNLKRMQQALINQFTTISRVATAMAFEPEIKYAQHMVDIAGLSEATMKKGTLIQQQWINRLLGRASGTKEQTIGKYYGASEDVYAQVLQTLYDTKLSHFKSGQTPIGAKSDWKGLQDALPDYNPFKDSQQFLDNTMKVKLPINARSHVGMLNSIVAATGLRMFNLGLSLVNIMALPTLIPVVHGALKIMPREEHAEWLKRIGAWGSVVDEGHALWNPYRAMVTGVHYMWTKEGRDILKEAGAKGHLWQKAVEQMQLFTRPSNSYMENMIKKGVDWVSKPVDKTEEWSRAISYISFYKMGKDCLLLNKEDAMEFARHNTNDVIGDFRPNNRPQIFQGAAGMPFGLFTTFAWNYLQRVFGYLEKGQFKDFAHQMGIQAMFFGAKSLPGFNQYISNFTSNYDGSENLVDRLQKVYGTEATDALLYGSVGSLTGLSTWTKTDIPLPGSNYLRDYNVFDMAPATRFVKDTYKAISATIGSLEANGGINQQQLSEIAAKTFPITAVRGWLDVWNGRSVDSSGMVTNENVRNAVDIAGKVLGMKSIREQSILEEMGRVRTIQLNREAAAKQFHLAIRASFRAGKLTQDQFESLIVQYGKSTGGDYSNFVNVLKREHEYALVNKGYLQLLRDRTNASNKDRMLRMIHALDGQNFDWSTVTQ